MKHVPVKRWVCREGSSWARWSAGSGARTCEESGVSGERRYDEVCGWMATWHAGTMQVAIPGSRHESSRVKLCAMFPRIHVKFEEDEHGNTHALAVTYSFDFRVLNFNTRY